MTVFNAFYTFASGRRQQPIDESSIVTVQIANRSRAEETVVWLKWTLSLPVSTAHLLYNIFLMAKHQEINQPVQQQVYSGNQIHSMPSVSSEKSLHIVSSVKVWSAVSRHFHNDSTGPFEGQAIERAWLPLVCDLFEEAKSLPIDELRETFLLSCHSDQVAALRAPFLHFIGPQALDHLMPKLNNVTEEILDWLAQQEKQGSVTISAKKLTELFIVTTLGRVLLGFPGTLDTYQQMGNAATCAFQFQLIRQWSTPSTAQWQEYHRSLEIIKSAIENCQGEFRDYLMNSTTLTPLQIKETLLVAYIGGSDTTSSTLQYVLWRLGRESSATQNLLAQESGSDKTQLNQFIAECLRLYAPGYPVRFARKNVDICVKNPTGEEWKYRVWKGNGILFFPSLAGRSRRFDSPHSFSPSRFEGKTDLLPNKPFSTGAHNCPGQWFAKAEILTFSYALLQRYDITSQPDKEELDVKGFMTLQPEEISLLLTRKAPA
jgi:cytochrome P450